MKNPKFVQSLLLAITLLATVSVFMAGCDDEEDPELALTALTAGGIDLNGATSPTNVPTDATITATFSTNVDAASVSSSTVKLIRDYDDAEMELDLSTSGSTVTITPAEELGSGTLYILRLESGIQSSAGKTLAAAERNFTTAGSFSPSGVIAHFTFENNTNDVIGDFDPAVTDATDVTYVDSRKAGAGKAASFNGTSTIVQVPNADDFMSYGDFAMSFWVKPTFTEGKGHFVLGLAAWYGFQFEIPDDYSWVKMAIRYEIPTGTDAEDSWYPGNGETKDNGGFVGWTLNKDVTPPGVGDTYFKDKWAHVVITYNKTTKVNTMYINGEPVKEHDFDLFPDANPKKGALGVKFAGNANGNKLALGFIQGSENRIVADEWADPSITTNKHYKGLMDDVRVFNRPLTATEVLLMYNSEKP
jgi:hypothetical protein